MSLQASQFWAIEMDSVTDFPTCQSTSDELLCLDDDDDDVSFFCKIKTPKMMIILILVELEHVEQYLCSLKFLQDFKYLHVLRQTNTKTFEFHYFKTLLQIRFN